MANHRSPHLLIILLLVLSSVFLFLRTSPFTTNPTLHHRRRHLLTPEAAAAAESHCQGTLYPSLCVSTLRTIPDLHKKSLSEAISATIGVTVKEVEESASNCSGLGHAHGGRSSRSYSAFGQTQQRAIADCLELLDDSADELESALSDVGQKNSAAKYDDIRTLLSAAMTNQYTCLEGFSGGGANKTLRDKILKPQLMRISRHVSNALAMLKKAAKHITPPEPKVVYRLADDGFPRWLSKKDRRLLQAAVNETKYNLVVAKDGTGNFSTVSEAVEAAPNKTATRFIIYIKAGAYLENVEVVKKKTNLMFIGDGIEKTVIKASRNVVDGWTTFRSATVAVSGAGFIAKGISFENSAGASKHQAVAFRSSADLSAFYRCSFVAYQDTLYTHSLRQFYRDCDVYGTVDFIFGNAAVVFQNCNLYARKPNENQSNIFTAQGREDPNQNTGISILNCKVAAAADLIPVQSSFRSYLGRPWRQYSRTVYLLSNIGDLVEPAGWLEWSGDFGLSTLYYGEYKNRGPGSNTSARVTWPGYRVINSSEEASQFTVGSFIQGAEWLTSYNIPLYLNLTT
ncbi:hypothetical protein V2J09_016061 [Rumex salicifolius]